MRERDRSGFVEGDRGGIKRGKKTAKATWHGSPLGRSLLGFEGI